MAGAPGCPEFRGTELWLLWSVISIVFCHKLCPTLCDVMDCSTLGFPVPHYLLEFAQTHVHWVGDATPPSHPLLPTSAPALNLSLHQGLYQWVSSSHQVAKVIRFSALSSVLPMNSQGWFPLGLTGLISLQSKGLSKSLLQHHSHIISLL